jgi:hypothetical protein
VFEDGTISYADRPGKQFKLDAVFKKLFLAEHIFTDFLDGNNETGDLDRLYLPLIEVITKPYYQSLFAREYAGHDK